ncbi:hypothetical protein CBR_g49378 [Chara braunii]|uniref:Uncharacterized protein n=1 Tax=Chara braunii TaxID=69332 RepID=A0A388M4T1_CHABU|nr:hypothetical protein CBR_g49378 [Chara braunii]|eukprot:GBG89588.1 hypothetical protein CBR_g49378 [Chara braunii]
MARSSRALIHTVQSCTAYRHKAEADRYFGTYTLRPFFPSQTLWSLAVRTCCLLLFVMDRSTAPDASVQVAAVRTSGSQLHCACVINTHTSCSEAEAFIPTLVEELVRGGCVQDCSRKEECQKAYFSFLAVIEECIHKLSARPDVASIKYTYASTCQACTLNVIPHCKPLPQLVSKEVPFNGQSTTALRSGTKTGLALDTGQPLLQAMVDEEVAALSSLADSAPLQGKGRGRGGYARGSSKSSIRSALETPLPVGSTSAAKRDELRQASSHVASVSDLHGANMSLCPTRFVPSSHSETHPPPLPPPRRAVFVSAYQEPRPFFSSTGSSVRTKAWGSVQAFQQPESDAGGRRVLISPMSLMSAFPEIMALSQPSQRREKKKEADEEAVSFRIDTMEKTTTMNNNRRKSNNNDVPSQSHRVPEMHLPRSLAASGKARSRSERRSFRMVPNGKQQQGHVLRGSPQSIAMTTLTPTTSSTHPVVLRGPPKSLPTALEFWKGLSPGNETGSIDTSSASSPFPFSSSSLEMLGSLPESAVPGEGTANRTSFLSSAGLEVDVGIGVHGLQQQVTSCILAQFQKQQNAKDNAAIAFSSTVL